MMLPRELFVKGKYGLSSINICFIINSFPSDAVEILWIKQNP